MADDIVLCVYMMHKRKKKDADVVRRMSSSDKPEPFVTI